MEPPERAEVSPQLPAGEDVSQTIEPSSVSQDQKQLRLTTDDWELQQPGGHSLDLDFQDSNLSPALSLLPGAQHNMTEYSLFQQSDNEFAPLRAYPDISTASGRFDFPPQDHTTQALLSQHPLAQATILSEEGASSCLSLSQHSLSPGAGGREEDAPSREKDSVTLPNPLQKIERQAVEDETYFLSKDIPAKQLLVLLQKDVGMLSSSSSAVSSVSETSVKSTSSFAKVNKPSPDQSLVRREGPPGEAALPRQQTQQPDTDRSSEICNITTGPRSTQPDDSSEMLHRELLSEVEKLSSFEAASKNKQRKQPPPSPPAERLTPSPTETSEVKPSLTQTHPGNVPFSAGVVRIQREHDLWSSGNQTGIDGSYLGFLPQSQSTPGVFKAPSKSSIKAAFGQLSAIDSNKEKSYQSSAGVSPQPVVPEPDHHPDTTNPRDEAEVRSLPSLNYIQKVDAWRANQTSSKTSLFDSLALQGFSGVSPKKKAYDAVSDSLNRILSQQARSLQQLPVSSATGHSVTQSSSTVPSGSSSPRRGEAVGSAPSDRDTTESSARPSASSFGRSQSHSSINTVIMPVQKDQQTLRPAEEEHDVHHQPSDAAEPAPRLSLAQFSDVSVDRDLTLSSSQDSYKVGTSIGASSLTSLEVDNYAPYWTSKISTPPPLPRTRELNIEERIPLYLRNLGIDQSPSTILTPFAPRGPIREPEFSPTDLCTIKGSIGTPSKSTQPSEGGSVHKGEFSRSSVMSVDSSVSIPFSLDSLGASVSVLDRPRRPSPTSDIDAERGLKRSFQFDEDSHSSILQPSQHAEENSSLTSSQNSEQPGKRIDAKWTSSQRDSESSVLMRRSLEQRAEDSFVSSKTLEEIRRLLSQAENVVSAGSSAASSAAPRLLSDDDIFLSSRKKTSRLQDSSFSSLSGAVDARTQTSSLWARSSSDSMLTSEKSRQNLTGRESLTSSWKPDNPATRSLTTVSAADSYKLPQDSGVSRGAGLSARRAEPEGCSAAPPDNTVPTQPVVNPQPVVNAQQLTLTKTEIVGDPEEEGTAADDVLVQSNPASPPGEDTDQGVMSDGSSESSLAVRVAKLLQNETPSTMMSSTPSVTDQEESKAREWIKLKISGQQCEPLELDKEDRQRIEEIKRELMLKYPMKGQLSTDTESSASSSVKGLRAERRPPPAETFAATDANNKPLQSLDTKPSKSNVQLQKPLSPEALEAQILEIAAREGITLPRTKPLAFTSITIATRKRSTSPSPSTSPAPPSSPPSEPLHLTELSAAAVEYHAADDGEEAPAFEPSSRLYARKQDFRSQLMSGSQRRQEAVGQFDEAPSTLNREEVDIEDELSLQGHSASAAHGAERTSGSSTSEPPGAAGHVSHVRLTLSPKAADHGSAPGSSRTEAARDFVPLRRASPAVSSPDEGVGSSSPPEWTETQRHQQQQGSERAGTSSLFTTAAAQGRNVSTSKQTPMPRHRPEAAQRPETSESPAAPVLLPYKPRGSDDLFYVPQLEVDVSTGPSDTTMESSHTGSDDAVPPRFSSDVLGHKDPGLDRGVAIRHAEGIYSKRLKTATFRMQEQTHGDVSVTADKSSQTTTSQTPKPSSHMSVAFTRVSLPNDREVSKKDQGTNPVQFAQRNGRERFQPVHVEETRQNAASLRDRHRDRGTDPLHFKRDRPEQRRERFHPVHVDELRRDDVAEQQGRVSLDELWLKFCDRWTVEDTRPTSDREALLLERLERLSRLIHSTRQTNTSESAQRDLYSTKLQPGSRRDDETREERRWNVSRGSRKFEDKPPSPRQVWTQTPQTADDDDGGGGRDSLASSFSSQSLHLCPADRDDSEAASSLSTIDTDRLVQAFGARRVQHLKSSSSLKKLYNVINKQKEGREQRRGRNKDSPQINTPTETAATDESTVASDSASSASAYTLPRRHGDNGAVKVVNKGIQTAGDLEIVRNGTRRHTRDVGTTFPSPHDTRSSRQNSSSLSSSERGRGGWKSPPKSQSSHKQRKNKRSPAKPLPQPVSWFISADDLRSDWRKENEETWRPSTAWFQPYGGTQPWREPLRQRHVQEVDRDRHHSLIHEPEPDPGPRTKTTSSGLTRVSLQEALMLRRPEFISRSTQRAKLLALQAEERRIHADAMRDRDEFFNQRRGPGRLPRPAGAALLRRAVPRKEMIQRSKQIYETLPEVQRRKEEERRKAEYRSYRLNAQLYNKRITNHVLGRRTAWK